MELSFDKICRSLRDTGFGGVSVPPGSFPSLYAMAASGAGASLNVVDPPSQWAVISYVKTNSPTEGVGGMPAYVAAEVEDVLDALVATGVVKNRALYWEAIGSGRDGAEAARALHCIGAPIICVPPTRTREYSRFQRPDRWDSNTHLALVSFENMLRNCETCSRLCPDEWDTRLLNVAAALQTWPVADAMIGSVGRGAFVSFESFDRYAYTIEWLLVLLHLALESGDYVASLVEKSVELYGQPLFRPCGRCVSNGKEVHGRNGLHPNLKLLEECISQLVVQTSRFTLTRAEDRATHKLWTLSGLQRTPGENVLWRYIKNETRLEVLGRRTGASITDLRLIAAGMLRGRPSEGYCNRHANKWTAALVCANPIAVCSAFVASASQGTLCKGKYRKVVRDVLRCGAFAFGSFISFNARYATQLHPEIRKCKRAPKCTGLEQLCLFSEHSGIVPPTASVHFLRDSFLSPEEIADVANENLAKLSNGVIFARICYLASWRFSAGKEVCCACQPARRALNESRRLILIAWDPAFRHALPLIPRAPSRSSSSGNQQKTHVCETLPSSSPQSGQLKQGSGRKTSRPESIDKFDSGRRKRPRADPGVSSKSRQNVTEPKIENESSSEQSEYVINPNNKQIETVSQNVDGAKKKHEESSKEKCEERSESEMEVKRTITVNLITVSETKTEMTGTTPNKRKNIEEEPAVQQVGNSNNKEKLENNIAGEPSSNGDTTPKWAEKNKGEEAETHNVDVESKIEKRAESNHANQAKAVDRTTIVPDVGLVPPYASPVLSYVVVDALKMGHVLVSGVDAVVRGPPSTTICTVCGGSMTILDVELSDETLEIHNDQFVNAKQAAAGLVAGIKTAHEIYSVSQN